MNRLRKFMAGLGVSLVSLLVILLVLEVGLRLFGNVEPYGYPPGLFVADPACEFRFAPNFGPAPLVKQEFETWLQTNADGFRDRDHGPKIAGMVRILSIGDSFVWGGYGVEPQDTYSAVLEKRLNDASETPRYEVLNLGVVAWGTDNALGFYRAYAGRYDADIVLLSFCVANDFFDNLLTNQLVVHEGNLVNASSVEEVSTLKAIRNFLVSRSRLYAWMERRLVQAPAARAYFQKRALERGELLVHDRDRMEALYSIDRNPSSELAKKTADLILEFNEECRRHGARLVVFAVPAQFQVDEPVVEYMNRQYGLDPATMGAPQKFLRDLCEKNGIPFIDPMRRFSEGGGEKRLFWTLNPHFNAPGNHLAAETLYEGLQAAGVAK